jgi:hypothetical protein
MPAAGWLLIAATALILVAGWWAAPPPPRVRSEQHTSVIHSLERIAFGGGWV